MEEKYGKQHASLASTLIPPSPSPQLPISAKHILLNRTFSCSLLAVLKNPLFYDIKLVLAHQSFKNLC